MPMHRIRMERKGHAPAPIQHSRSLEEVMLHMRMMYPQHDILSVEIYDPERDIYDQPLTQAKLWHVLFQRESPDAEI